MKKYILIEKTSKYISIQSYLIGRLNIANIEREGEFISPEVSMGKLGGFIKSQLAESREISVDEFVKLFNNRESVELFYKIKERKIMDVYCYKDRRFIYKDTLFLSVLINNESLYVTPLHQDGLGTFGTVKDNSGKAVQFEYPTDLSDEELGKAVMEGFKYCTSIYQKKK